MKLNEIHIRDPFILLDSDTYYLYGTRGSELKKLCTGLDVYTSTDLVEWSNPFEVFRKPENFWADRNFWAPEVHKYNRKFFMFVTFKSTDRCRGTQILIADKPTGPFKPHSDGPITRKDWECLDGTLYIDKSNVPYMVFCHEWNSIKDKDGEMWAVRLSADLKTAVGEPFLLFKASEPSWALHGSERFVTDGPFMYRTKGGQLLMIWSSLDKSGYVEAIAVSDNGDITGKWSHNQDLLFTEDGGHGMIFKTTDGEKKLVLHAPNKTPYEHPIIIDLIEENNRIYTI